MVNKYAANCAGCGARVPANGGVLVGSRRTGWSVFHLACKASGRSEVVETVLSSGEVLTQNRRGRCEDAPCCGCCNY
jgi:hypothetical protein